MLNRDEFKELWDDMRSKKESGASNEHAAAQLSPAVSGNPSPDHVAPTDIPSAPPAPPAPPDSRARDWDSFNSFSWIPPLPSGQDYSNSQAAASVFGENFLSLGYKQQQILQQVR